MTRTERAIGAETRDASGQAVVPTPVSAQALRDSYRHCAHVTRRRARNFHYGLKLTPQPKRGALYAIYAFMRACDDMADDAAANDGAKAALDQIERFRATMQQVLDLRDGESLPNGPDAAHAALWPAFHHVMQTYPVDPQHLHAMLDGQRDDLRGRRIEHFDQLYDYCYKVASTVGLVCLSVWGYDGDSQAKKLAEYRGIAFQLTNILRDLTEDADAGRMYLPQEDLERFGVNGRDLTRRRASTGFDRLMRYQIARAESYYDLSAALERHITPNCRATSWAMTRIYRELLMRIAGRPRRVLSERIRLTRGEKSRIALRALWRRTRGK